MEQGHLALEFIDRTDLKDEDIKTLSEVLDPNHSYVELPWPSTDCLENAVLGHTGGEDVTSECEPSAVAEVYPPAQQVVSSPETQSYVPHVTGTLPAVPTTVPHNYGAPRPMFLPSVYQFPPMVNQEVGIYDNVASVNEPVVEKQDKPYDVRSKNPRRPRKHNQQSHPARVDLHPPQLEVIEHDPQMTQQTLANSQMMPFSQSPYAPPMYAPLQQYAPPSQPVFFMLPIQAGYPGVHYMTSFPVVSNPDGTCIMESPVSMSSIPVTLEDHVVSTAESIVSSLPVPSAPVTSHPELIPASGYEQIVVSEVTSNSVIIAPVEVEGNFVNSNLEIVDSDVLEAASPAPIVDSQETSEEVSGSRSPDIPVMNGPSVDSSVSAVSTPNSSQRSWADLFKNSPNSISSPELGTTNSVVNTSMDANRVNNCTSSGAGTLENETGDTEDAVSLALGAALKEFTVDHSPPNFEPRGLINSSNWCYINATLQALLACPAFYNLLYNLPIPHGLQKGKTSTPVINSLAQFVHEFSIPVVQTKSKKKEFDKPFEPRSLLNMLGAVKSECAKGRQEDAEEFLGFILNGLHDEMVAIMQNTKNGTAKQCNGEIEANGHLEDSGEDDDKAWCTMGHKNKNLVTRSTKHSQSPISEIFQGEMRSSLTAAGNESSAYFQPFFTLLLDIQDGMKTVEDALEKLAAEEYVQDYRCNRTKQEVEAKRKMTLEKLPPVLILHLKRFIYNKDGGCKKLLNEMDIPPKFELDRKLLSADVKGKLSLKFRTYNLFAVVYHSGEDAGKGHYIADVFHQASSVWLRCDDRTITQISESELLKFNNPHCVPYLLFYRRLDTLPVVK